MSQMEIDAAAIRELAALLDETGLTEIEVADGDKRLRISRGAPPAIVGAPALVSAADASALSASPCSPTDPAALGGAPITSPMVGTVYLAPEPGASPFVRPGDHVVEGQTILIVEAMKVMNPIRAPRNGSVKAVVVSDAQPVEYGEVLMVLD